MIICNIFKTFFYWEGEKVTELLVFSEKLAQL